MGTPLLVRGKRSVTLTDEGYLSKQQAETIVELSNKLEHTFRDQKDVICDACINGNLTGSVYRISDKTNLSYMPGMICDKRQVLDSTLKS